MINKCLNCNKQLARNYPKYPAKYCQSCSKKGREITDKWREKISKTLKIKGIKPPSQKGKIGEDSANWKEGISLSPEYNQIMGQKRRNRLILNGGKLTIQEWKELKRKYNYTCLFCKRREPEIKLTIDHILPIIHNGSHSLENIQPLCFSCNAKKHTSMIDYRPSFQLL